MKTTTALAATTLVVGSMLSTTPAAVAVDHRSCVSKAEFRSVPLGLTRAEVEARWEVVGVHPAPVRGRYQTQLVYPVCNYSFAFSEVDVWYRNRDNVWAYGQIVLAHNGNHHGPHHERVER